MIEQYPLLFAITLTNTDIRTVECPASIVTKINAKRCGLCDMLDTLIEQVAN